jgi:hypothetical protein
VNPDDGLDALKPLSSGSHITAYVEPCSTKFYKSTGPASNVMLPDTWKGIYDSEKESHVILLASQMRKVFILLRMHLGSVQSSKYCFFGRWVGRVLWALARGPEMRLSIGDDEEVEEIEQVRLD